MSKVAVILADGFEEIEALTVVDVLRRAKIECDTISINKIEVTGAHNISVKADSIISDKLKEYDLIVLPGGMPGSTNLRDNNKVIEIVKYFSENNKLIGAICAAPIVLAKADVIDGRTITSYPGYEEELSKANYISDKIVVEDGNIITSRGPATALEFSYKLLEKLGVSYKELSDGMMYDFLKSTSAF